MKKLLFIVVILFLCSSTYAQPLKVFKGRPSIKISEGGSARTPEKLTTSKAVNLACIISKIGDDYFWASRENTPLSLVDSGAFITFVALNGSGYIRIIKDDMKQAASMMSETEKDFDYVEHLLIGLRSVTYYGSSG
jgi:hypothetical protein